MLFLYVLRRNPRSVISPFHFSEWHHPPPPCGQSQNQGASYFVILSTQLTGTSPSIHLQHRYLILSLLRVHSCHPNACHHHFLPKNNLPYPHSHTCLIQSISFSPIQMEKSFKNVISIISLLTKSNYGFLFS